MNAGQSPEASNSGSIVDELAQALDKLLLDAVTSGDLGSEVKETLGFSLPAARVSTSASEKRGLFSSPLANACACSFNAFKRGSGKAVAKEDDDRLLAARWSTALAARFNSQSTNKFGLRAVATATGFLNFFSLESEDGKKASCVTSSSNNSWTRTADAFSASFPSIGRLESCFKEKHGTPRQGTVCPAARARLRLHAHIPSDSLVGLDEYSHVWLVFVFHANSDASSGLRTCEDNEPTRVDAAAFKSKVKPPRLGGDKLGVFATRSPHRFNPIGMTVAKLDRMDAGVLHLSCIDLIDGTPILDIKPYHPADCVPDARFASWLPTPSSTTVHSVANSLLAVRFSTDAEKQLRQFAPLLDFYNKFEDIRDAISQALSLDPRSVHSRSKHEQGAIYGLQIDRLDVVFRVTSADASAAAERKRDSESAVAERTLLSPASEPTLPDLSAVADVKAAVSDGASRVTSSQSQKVEPKAVETAVVLKIVFCPDDKPRPRMRDKTWFDAISKEFPA